MTTPVIPASVDRLYRIGLESSRGVLPTNGANKELTALSIDPTAKNDAQKYRAAGYKNNTVVVPNMFRGEGNYEGPLDFNHIIYPVAGLWGMTGNPSGAGAAKTWVSAPAAKGPDSNAKTYVIEKITNSLAQRYLLTKLTSLQLSSSQGPIRLTGNCLSRYPTEGETPSAGSVNEVQTLSKTGTVTGGTFTLTYSGQTTAAIAYNASAATIKQKLIDLNNIGSDDVDLTGGPVNTTAVQINFQGALAGTDVAALTVDSASLTGGGTYGIAETVKGASTGITTVPQRPVTREMIDLFVDDTYGGLGTTKVGTPYEETLNVGAKDTPFWAHNTDFDSYIDLIEIEHELTFNFKMAHDTQSIGFFNSIPLNQKKFVRWQSQGSDEIETGVFEKIMLDMCLMFTGSDDILGDPAYGKQYNSELVPDASLGGAMRWTIINRLTSAYLS